MTTSDYIDAFALTGGCFIFFAAIFSFIFSIGVEWLMNLEIVRNLFKVDPTLGKKNKSLSKMKTSDPKQLLEQAKDIVKNRVTITNRCCDKVLLVVESAMQCIICRQTKFARIVKEGVGQLRGELDIYNYMKKLRMTYAVINALTSFN